MSNIHMIYFIVYMHGISTQYMYAYSAKTIKGWVGYGEVESASKGVRPEYLPDSFYGLRPQPQAPEPPRGLYIYGNVVLLRVYHCVYHCVYHRAHMQL